MQPVVKCNWYPRQFAGGHFEPSSIWPGSGCCLLRLNTISGRPGRFGCTICTGALFAWVHFFAPIWFPYLSGFRTGTISVLIPAGGCTRAVAPFAGVKVCAAIGANGEISVLHRLLLSALYNARTCRVMLNGKVTFCKRYNVENSTSPTWRNDKGWQINSLRQ